MNQTPNKSAIPAPSNSHDISTKREVSPSSSGMLHQNDEQFQAVMLAGVSRTFALTIPRLPEKLRKVVSNAYLLCRTIDTIEDEPGISTSEKKTLSHLFLKILESEHNPGDLSSKLSPLLSHHTIPAEHELIQKLPRVISITRSFDQPQQQALIRCVRIMAEGMIYFQEHASAQGLKNQQELDKYCYYVAGVVGEMLTELFCHYSQEIAQHRKVLFDLSGSFGQGLQMTNILKDIWDDQKRGVCWLPQKLFQQKGLSLTDISSFTGKKDYQAALKELIGIAHGHLENALNYTLLIPPHEKGIREFCLWALGMAMLTLRKINRNPGFTEASQVKISRNSVKATVIISGLCVSRDKLLNLLFDLLAKGLPKANNVDFTKG